MTNPTVATGPPAGVRVLDLSGYAPGRHALDEVFKNEHAIARQMLIEVDDPKVGAVHQVGIGPKYSGTPGNVRLAAPAPGEHTTEVLRDLERDDAGIERLRGAGVVG